MVVNWTSTEPGKVRHSKSNSMEQSTWEVHSGSITYEILRLLWIQGFCAVAQYVIFWPLYNMRLHWMYH